MAIFGLKTANLAIFMAKSRQIGEIQVGTTLMYIFSLIHAQKALRNPLFEFPRGSLPFSRHSEGEAPPLITRMVIVL